MRAIYTKAHKDERDIYFGAKLPIACFAGSFVKILMLPKRVTRRQMSSKFVQSAALLTKSQHFRMPVPIDSASTAAVHLRFSSPAMDFPAAEFSLKKWTCIVSLM